MTNHGEKTQPQELLEEVIGITHGDTPEFPSLEAQQEYWRQKDLREGRAEIDPDAFKCLTCKPERVFKSAQAVRMHVARVHTKTIRVPRQKPPESGRPVETQFTRRKWSLARRRRYNAKKKALAAIDNDLHPARQSPTWQYVEPPPQEEPVAMIKFCPHCGKGLERFMA